MNTAPRLLVSRLSMRLLLFFAPLLVACSGTATDPANATPDDAGVDAAPSGPFDLDLTIRETLSSGEPASTYMFAAVRDADTKELVAFVAEGEKLVGGLTIRKPGVLQAGHRYEIGVKDTWFSGCKESGSNVWYREIPAVAAHVTLTVEVRLGAERDERGCDVLHEPVALPTGTYATKAPILGIAGNVASVVVSPSGRVYTDRLRILCGTDSSCSSTSVSIPACKYEQAILPGEVTFSFGSSLASRTTIKGEATIDPASGSIRYKGRVYTWTSGGTNCCDETFDVVLTKVGDAAACE